MREGTCSTEETREVSVTVRKLTGTRGDIVDNESRPLGATTVMHPFKAGAPDALKAQLPTWVWPLGDGLLPIPLVGTYAAPGSGAWELDAPLLARLRQVDPKASESWDFWVSPRRCKENFPCAAVPPVDEMAL